MLNKANICSNDDDDDDDDDEINYRASPAESGYGTRLSNTCST
jgi:hypothetical protein